MFKIFNPKKTQEKTQQDNMAILQLNPLSWFIIVAPLNTIIMKLKTNSFIRSATVQTS